MVLSAILWMLAIIPLNHDVNDFHMFWDIDHLGGGMLTPIMRDLARQSVYPKICRLRWRLAEGPAIEPDGSW